LENLKTLVLAHNNLTGPLPDGFSKLRRLKVLYLQHNRFEGRFPEGLLELGSSLITLSLRGNVLTGNVPTGISRLRRLERLHLGSNKFDGEIPGAIGEMSALRHLYLDHNHFTGEVPTDDLARPPNIATIDLRENADLKSRGRASRRISIAIRRKRRLKSVQATSNVGRMNVRVLMINPTAEYSDDAENWRV
jgi:Leucine-rich repeat (LRR) protein